MTFLLSYRRPTLVLHKSLNKQRLIKETNINKHLHNKNPLISYSESDKTRCLHYAVLLVGLRHAAMWMHYDPQILDTFYRLTTGEYIKHRYWLRLVKMRVSSNRRTCEQTSHNIYFCALALRSKNN